ncbi:MAG: TonB-dependent receptor [Bacteroidota bacterium]
MKQKLYIFFFTVALLGSTLSYGQENDISRVKVIDKVSLTPIEGVFIFSLDNSKGVQTDRKGFIDLSEFGEDELVTIQHPSYRELTIKISDIKAASFVIRMDESIIKMSELVVSANKWEQDAEEIPNEIVSILPKEIAFNNSQTAADVLAQTGQVFVQKSQLGGGSPIMRGFAANRVLVVVDGVRMNNAIFRSGNLQNVISVDPNVLQSTEVIFGPGSVIYGSDALGGVMDFHTIDPKLANEGRRNLWGSGLTRISSANNEKTFHGQIGIGGEKLSAFTSFSISDFGDLRTGSNRTDAFPDFGTRPIYVTQVNGEDIIAQNDDINLQRFSGYKQYNTLSKIRYKVSDALEFKYGFYFSTTSDIPRYDRLIERNDDGSLRQAEWYYGPQRWAMHTFSTQLTASNSFFDQARLVLAYQDVEESRHDRRLSSSTSDRLRSRTEQVNVYTLNVDFDKSISDKHKIFYGAEYVENDIESTAFRRNIFTGEITPTATRYPDGGSSYTSVAAYFNYKWIISPRSVITSGIRYSRVSLNASLEDQSELSFPFDELDISNGATNGSLGYVFRPSEDLKLSFNLSSGFRSPNIDDVGKVFEGVNDNVTVPNPDLQPEFTYNGEVGVSKTFDQKVRVRAVAFYTLLRDAIVRRDFTFNGQDSILFDGEMKRVQSQVNTGEAFIFGGSLNLNVDFNRQFALTSSVTFTDGEDTEANEPLRHTTPVFGQTRLIYRRDRLRGEFIADYSGGRSFENLSPSERDKPDLYTEDGALGWYTLNLKASYQVNDYIQVNGGIENILDRHYRPYSSGISAPGRNFILSLRASIN